MIQISSSAMADERTISLFIEDQRYNPVQCNMTRIRAAVRTEGDDSLTVSAKEVMINLQHTPSAITGEYISIYFFISN